MFISTMPKYKHLLIYERERRNLLKSSIYKNKLSISRGVLPMQPTQEWSRKGWKQRQFRDFRIKVWVVRKTKNRHPSNKQWLDIINTTKVYKNLVKCQYSTMGTSGRKNRKVIADSTQPNQELIVLDIATIDIFAISYQI